MNRAEYEKQWADSAGCTVGFLHTHGRYAIPCHCDEDMCEGWQMLHTNHLDHIDKKLLGVTSSHSPMDVRMALLRWVQLHTIKRREPFADDQRSLVSDNEAVEELFDALSSLASETGCCVCLGLVWRNEAPYCSDSRHPRCEEHKYPCRMNDECGADHATYCCRVHSTHADPHRGCILR